jgi:hypothetical protein
MQMGLVRPDEYETNDVDLDRYEMGNGGTPWTHPVSVIVQFRMAII